MPQSGQYAVSEILRHSFSARIRLFYGEYALTELNELKQRY